MGERGQRVGRGREAALRWRSTRGKGELKLYKVGARGSKWGVLGVG